MLKIARNSAIGTGRDVREAYLRLTPSLDTRVTELFEENVAMVDYQLKPKISGNFWPACRKFVRESGADGENPV